MTRACLLLAALALTACGPAEKAPTTGNATLYFALSANAKSSPNLVSPVLGTFYGDLYLVEDVSVTGPRADAMAFGAVEVADIDLRTKMPTQVAEQTALTVDLAPGKYVALGFLDVNGNGAATHNPDSGDPVTLALTNQFEIVVGQTTKRTVLFELIYN